MTEPRYTSQIDYKATNRSLKMFEGLLIKGPTTFEDLRNPEKWDTLWLTMIQEDLMSTFIVIQDEIIRRAEIGEVGA